MWTILLMGRSQGHDRMERNPVRASRVPVHRAPFARHHALIAAAICWQIFAVLAVLAVLVVSGRSAGVDDLGLLAFRRLPGLELRGPEWLAEAARDMTALGGVLLRHLFAVCALGVLAMLHLRREAVVLFVTITVGWGMDLLLKQGFARPRPDVVPHLVAADGSSFPSGHSFNAAVVYVSIGLVFAAMSRRSPVRRTIIGAAIAVSLLAGISRVMLGVHYPSDVMARAMGGAGWTFLVFGLFSRSHDPQRPHFQNR